MYVCNIYTCNNNNCLSLDTIDKHTYIFRYFLNTYKKYKSYYPLRYMKNKTTTALNNSVICDSIDAHISE